MQWETYTEKVLDESFLARIEQLNSIVQQLDPQQKSYTTGRLNLARQEWEANRTQTPGHLFRPAALKLANVTKIIAQGLLQLGLPADAADRKSVV